MGSPRPESAAYAEGVRNDKSTVETYTPTASPAAKTSARTAFSLRFVIRICSRMRTVELSRLQGSSTYQLYPTSSADGSVWFGDLIRNARRSKSAKCAKRNGDPGAIRTRDPQLRRLIGKSRNLLLILRYSDFLVRSGSARKCHRMTPRPQALSQRNPLESRIADLVPGNKKRRNFNE